MYWIEKIEKTVLKLMRRLSQDEMFAEDRMNCAIVFVKTSRLSELRIGKCRLLCAITEDEKKAFPKKLGSKPKICCFGVIARANNVSIDVYSI